MVFNELCKGSSANGDDLIVMMTINADYTDEALLGGIQGGSKIVY